MNTYPEKVTQTLDVSASDVSNSEGVTVNESEEKPAERVVVEELKISGDALVAKVKELIHQGNIRRIIIKNEEGYTLIEIPMTVGVLGGVISAAFFPVIAAVGIIGAMVAHLTIVIERQESADVNDQAKED
ncbi:hypothetical protein Lepto7375DRAFT_0373 [Leptolyngbya sp. PCC 7375]|nr:hypothetical protein Lepto7375DRAFT_0373 [Leptolyngbya sp. PCC 7375]